MTFNSSTVEGHAPRTAVGTSARSIDLISASRCAELGLNSSKLMSKAKSWTLLLQQVSKRAGWRAYRRRSPLSNKANCLYEARAQLKLLTAGPRAVASAPGKTAAIVRTIACRRLDREVSKTYASETLTVAIDASDQSREKFRTKTV